MSRKSVVTRESLMKKDGKRSKDLKGSKSSHSDTNTAEEEDTSRKSAALAFTILSKEDCDELLNTTTALEIESKLKERFELQPATDLKDAAILDYYVGAIYWGKKQGFTSQQLSGFFTVVHNLLGKIKDDQLSMVDLLTDYRKMLIGIGTDVGPDVESGGIEFFRPEEAKAITDYLKSSLFQHYKLYEFMFTKPQSEEIIGSDLVVEVPLPAETPFPPPLDEGISEVTYQDFLMIPTPNLSEMQEDSNLGQEPKPLTPIEVELPPEVEDLFAKLTPEDVKSVVEDVTTEVLQNLQVGVESKIRTHENNVLSRINKIHVVLPEPQPQEPDGNSK